MKKEKRELSPWGKQCKVQMLVLGKSLADLSAETKLSRTYISSIINGRMIVPEDTVRIISNALGVDMALRH
jgi:transcriptional regulator with XRE-family HTH domain